MSQLFLLAVELISHIKIDFCKTERYKRGKWDVIASITLNNTIVRKKMYYFPCNSDTATKECMDFFTDFSMFNVIKIYLTLCYVLYDAFFFNSTQNYKLCMLLICQHRIYFISLWCDNVLSKEENLNTF